MVSRIWNQAYLNLEKLRSVDELLKDGKELRVETINGTDTPTDGWIEVTFKLEVDDAGADELMVPVLLKQKDQNYLFISFTVIAEEI